jgi:hypothetical protein
MIANAAYLAIIDRLPRCMSTGARSTGRSFRSRRHRPSRAARLHERDSPSPRKTPASGPCSRIRRC